MKRKAPFWYALLATTCLVPLRPSLAGELPAGASVVHGTVGIATPGANTMTIQQSTAAAIVNWQSFSVGAGASVNIQQPSTSSALLNRVTGATTSTIAGQVSANGQVYLVNPNGIVITPSGTVRAGGGFVASTLGISDEDFKAGRRNFAGTGSSAAVVNQGTIEVGRGGYAALIGGSVENAGTISVPMGKVGLGAGERATLDISGDGFLQVAVPSGSAGEKALIQNSGRIRANGGRVEMQAATAREVARQAINLTGVVEARTVGGRSGAIILGGGAGGSVTVSGRLIATATRQGRRADAARSRSASAGKGGEITITGDRIALTGATIDASGRNGGGTIKIGGDLQGGGSLPHARQTIVDDKTQISADATESGNGGTVILWSDEFTGFGGLIRARGGANGGDGGFAEVSSKGVLGYDGQTILTAAQGKFGTLLLDPYNITISNGATTTGPGPGFTPGTENSVINVVDLQNALATANVAILTGGAGSSGTDPGNITVAAPISWVQATTLTLNAASNIAIQQAISAPAGGLTLSATGTITATAPVTVGTFTLQSGTWTQSGALPAFSATDFRLNGGRFLRVLGGDGVGTPYQITDIYGLQGINSIANLALSFQLANDIDASGTNLWNAGAGFVAIGGSTSGFPSFSGTLDGQGRTINGLFINRPGASNVGLFGSVTGNVTNLALTNVNLSGGSLVGAIAGANSGTISQVHASGTVSGVVTGTPSADNGATQIGGLVGSNNGTLTRSYSTVTVNGGAFGAFIGGLAGTNGGNGIISLSYAAGAVSVGDGGFSTSGAHRGGPIGGLVGQNLGSISQTYSTATVTAGSSIWLVGGLVGDNSFLDSEGGTFTGSITQSYATGAVSTGTGAQSVGGLAGQNLGSVSESYAAAPVAAGTGSTNVGGFIGLNTAAVDSSFWDTTASSQAAGFGTNSSTDPVTLTGLTTTQFQDAGTFVPQARGQGWSFEASWAPPSAGFYPELYVIAPVIRAVNDGVTRPYGGSNSIPLLTSYGGPGSFVFGPAGDSLDPSNALASPATTTSPVGTYAIGGVNQTSAQGLVYRVVATQTDAALTPSLTITPAPLTITADNQSKTYGSLFSFLGTEFSAGGLQNGETIGSAALSSAGAAATANAGLYPILIGGTAGGSFNPSNYAITYVPGTISVTPAPLTVIANNQIKTVGLPFSFAGLEFTAIGLQNGEIIGSAALSSEGASALASAGLYAILVGAATGGSFNPSNYAIAYVPGSMIVGGDPTLIDTPPAGNPTLNLPTTTVSLPNPPDSFDLSWPGGGGSGGVGGGGPTLGTGRPGELDAARNTLAAVERSSNDLEAEVARCDSRFERQKSVGQYKACVGDALEQFADALSMRSVDLPGPMRGIPAVIRQAAREVRAARTVQEARAAVGTAVAEVRKAIALIRADDPAIGRLQLQQANRIVSALGSVETRLSRATGL